MLTSKDSSCYRSEARSPRQRAKEEDIGDGPGARLNDNVSADARYSGIREGINMEG